ncbi:serine/threonine-protein kinase PknD [Mycobacterium sp. TY814]|uniref:serine/threonine-protein kinase PknD n=1 Tax=unclassified Mycobacterium TaxID=2642494 RepID=UPI0027420387|nr:serine/threonine-protein kinase PknD [Mycobacterium sp. TY814]MDP7724203.1 serine/threonine-protein kinase PknD [Mycobacterium sp. TY814]
MQETSFGKYRLIELMGRGGMGEVWRAYDADTDRVVALKILPSAVSNDEVFQQRFRREAHATARLNSPHLIPIHTYGEINGRLYVDMRLIEGHDLQWVLNQGPLPPARAVGIIDQVAKGLHAAHRERLLHRDVKPSNVLLDHDDFAYLIDFGIARAADDLSLTATGNFIGTYHYMAPERFTAAEVDSRSDIYSLACVLYECLTAQSPFPGDTLQEQITGHRSAPPPRPSNTNPDIPASLDMVIARGMAKNPGDRYDTAIELARDAANALTATAVTPTIRMNPAPAAYTNRLPRPDTNWRQPPAPPRPPPPPPPPPRRPAPPPPPQNVNPTMARPVVVPPPEPSVPRPAPAPPAPPARPWWRRKAVAVGAVLVAIVTVVAIVVIGTSGSNNDYEQVTLPFSGLRDPQGLSVDIGGTVYVADTEHNRILALFAGATEPHTLPFDGLNLPTGVTADNTGTVYVNDAGNKRVLVLRPGSQTQEVLPFTDLENPTGLTVDSSRTVYVADTGKNHVVALPAGSTTISEVPFTGLNNPTGLVVTGNGTVYVADGGNNRVLILPVETKKQAELPFSGLKQPGGLTLDSKGNVYLNDTGHNRTLKLAVGSSTQEELPFTGLDYPWGLSVDNSGTVYVGGRNDKIVALRHK